MSAGEAFSFANSLAATFSGSSQRAALALLAKASLIDHNRWGMRSTNGVNLAFWLLKTEPETWLREMQVKRGPKGEVWSGVRG